MSYFTLCLKPILEEQFPTEHLDTDGLFETYILDGLNPRNYHTKSLLYILQLKNKGQGGFYSLYHSKFELLEKLYFQNHGKNVGLLTYRGNHYSSINYLKDYPFIEFEHLLAEI